MAEIIAKPHTFFAAAPRRHLTPFEGEVISLLEEKTRRFFLSLARRNHCAEIIPTNCTSWPADAEPPYSA